LELGRITVGTVTLGRMTLGKMTLGKMTLGKMTLNKMILGKIIQIIFVIIFLVNVILYTVLLHVIRQSVILSSVILQKVVEPPHQLPFRKLQTEGENETKYLLHPKHWATFEKFLLFFPFFTSFITNNHLTQKPLFWFFIRELNRGTIDHETVT
jgi:hypothetical protein